MKNYYDILEIHPESSHEVIVAAYHSLYKRYNPGNFTDSEEKYQAKLKQNQVQEAYKILSDPKRRAKYDIALEKHKDNPSRFSALHIIVLFIVTIFIIVAGKFTADIFFPEFARLTTKIAGTPALKTVLILTLIGIAIHYFLTNRKKA